MRSPSVPPEPSPPPARPSLIAGRYRIEAAIGKGGVAQVFRVEDVSQGTRLALKRLRSDASKPLQALFETEYQTLASLRHPHTVEVYEYGRDQDVAFYTMELLEGGDLRARAPMPWREVCGALRDAALALGVLHARQLVHRDVSPRNLWRTPDGRVKLIDFGAVVGFGHAEQVIGTPPLLAPEAFYGRALDQRTDLYALGAVGYFLLSGRNAYAARELSELPELWKEAPPPPSASVAALQRPDLEPVPAELDALLLGLLSQNALARPSGTAEFIDRIDTLLGSAAQARVDSPELHLANSAFVGRAREQRRLRKLLRLASNGQGHSAMIEGEAGMGRSRLLHELALEARVADSVVLHVHAVSYPGLYGVASALALKLLDALPKPAHIAAGAHASTLAHVSSQLRERLGISIDKPPDVAGELRLRIQSALCEWFLQVAQQHTLVILVDGLELVDDGSCAFLLGLALAATRARVLLACTVLSDSRRQPSAAERALSVASRSTRLSALAPAATLELLQSVFGRADHLTRLASSLHDAARGTPGHVLELAAQLVRSQVIRFANGTWVLPQEVPEAQLPGSRQQALAVRLAHVTGPARELARQLSVQSGAISAELYGALAGTSPELTPLLATLREHEIMTIDEDGLRFAHEQFRVQLLAELSPEPKQRALRALGLHLLALPGAGAQERLRAGVHLVESGDLAAARIIAEAATHITLREPDRLAPAVPVIEHALALFRAAQRPAYEQSALLAPLAIAGYFVDRKLAVRYGDEALASLQQVMGLHFAGRLRPFLGARLALLIALASVAVRFLLRRKAWPAPSLADALTLLFMTVSALSASHALCYDQASTLRAANVLEPFTAFGSKHAAAFSYEVCRGLATAVRDTFGESHARWRRVVALLESKKRIFGLPDHLRVRYLSGLMFAMAIMDSQRDDDRSLRTADRLDQMGAALYPMSTDQLRAMYYAHHGDAKLYAHYRERAEQRAIQSGAIWQNETWTLLVEAIVALRHHDAMSMKRVSEQLRSACELIPTLSVFADRSRGTYLLLRERYEPALPWLEHCLSEAVRLNFGWGRSHGVLARAYNELGRHADARAACARVLAEFDAGDLAFPGLTLLIETERLVAEAGLGNFEQARRELGLLLDKHGKTPGPLTLAELHEAGLRIALLARHAGDAKAHGDEMAHWYGATGIPSLIQYCEVVAARTQAALGLAPATTARALGRDQTDTSASTFGTERSLADPALSLAEFTRRALRMIAGHERCTQGFLYWIDADRACRCVGALGDEPLDASVERWLQQRVGEAFEDTATKPLPKLNPSKRAGQDVFEHAGRYYRVIWLFQPGTTAQPFGGALLAADGEVPAIESAKQLQRVAHQMQRVLRRERVESTSS
jgi:Cdc6-like AAA superfamily ATPase